MMLPSIRMLAAVAVAFLLAAGAAPAKTLPLPQSLVALNSDSGKQLLLHSRARESYWNLSVQFVTQKTQTYCGIASMIMVLNALGTPAPSTPEYEPYRIFTQDNFLNDETEKVLPRSVLAEQGTTLDQIGLLLQAHGVRADVHHAADSSLEAFRGLAIGQLSKPGHYLIVNYLRAAMGQERGGHISPLAAYDEGADAFLILDVARYKYPPVWVKAAALFAAMNTTDADNGNRTRGFVLIDAGP